MVKDNYKTKENYKSRLENILDNYTLRNNFKDTYKINYKSYDNTKSLDSLISNIYSINSKIIPQQRPTNINWGETFASRETAYVEPNSEGVQRVLEAVHRIQELPEDMQKQLIEATREIRFFFDGQVRAYFGATRHYNAIRCLNDPTITQVSDTLNMRNTQLVGEEFFSLGRFMPNFIDIADIQWWAVYQNGSWRLDTWNPEGEHLDTGVNGWGNLIGSVMKVNGKTLSPQEMIAFYRTIRLRNERGFMTEQKRQAFENLLRLVNNEGRLPANYDEQLETAHDLGLVKDDGRTLTYVGMSIITPSSARQRKEKQLQVQGQLDHPERRIIIPTLFG